MSLASFTIQVASLHVVLAFNNLSKRFAKPNARWGIKQNGNNILCSNAASLCEDKQNPVMPHSYRIFPPKVEHFLELYNKTGAFRCITREFFFLFLRVEHWNSRWSSVPLFCRSDEFDLCDIVMQRTYRAAKCLRLTERERGGYGLRMRIDGMMSRRRRGDD